MFGGGFRASLLAPPGHPSSAATGPPSASRRAAPAGIAVAKEAQGGAGALELPEGTAKGRERDAWEAALTPRMSSVHVAQHSHGEARTGTPRAADGDESLALLTTGAGRRTRSTVPAQPGPTLERALREDSGPDDQQVLVSIVRYRDVRPSKEHAERQRQRQRQRQESHRSQSPPKVAPNLEVATGATSGMHYDFLPAEARRTPGPTPWVGPSQKSATSRQLVHHGRSVSGRGNKHGKHDDAPAAVPKPAHPAKGGSKRPHTTEGAVNLPHVSRKAEAKLEFGKQYVSPSSAAGSSAAFPTRRRALVSFQVHAVPRGRPLAFPHASGAAAPPRDYGLKGASVRRSPAPSPRSAAPPSPGATWLAPASRAPPPPRRGV